MEQIEQEKKKNEKKNLLRIVLLVLIIITFIIIFKFSGQNAEKSTSLSRGLTMYIINLAQKSKMFLESNFLNSPLQVEIFLRKMAHFTIYMILGILVMSFINLFRFKKGEKIAITILAGLGYAAFDELHQSFVPGRTALLTDVMIDTIGVTIGCLIVLGIIALIRRKRK